MLLFVPLLLNAISRRLLSSGDLSVEEGGQLTGGVKYAESYKNILK